MTTPETAILFESVEKNLSNKSILHQVNLPVFKGKTTVLLGQSGSGKTTLLRLAIGLLEPDGGKITTLGFKLHALSSKALLQLRHRFGVLFQDGGLFSSLSVFQNVAFPLVHHLNLKGSALKHRVDELLGLVGLSGIEGQMPEELSGGQKKRVGLARALALNPEVVFFDEPTSGLDPQNASRINHLIRDLQHRLGTTFFVITHDIASAKAIADFVCILKEGRIVQHGPANDILSPLNPHLNQLISSNEYSLT